MNMPGVLSVILLANIKDKSSLTAICCLTGILFRDRYGGFPLNAYVSVFVIDLQRSNLQSIPDKIDIALVKDAVKEMLLL